MPDRFEWEDGQVEVLEQGKDPLKNFPSGAEAPKGKVINIQLPDDPEDEPVIERE